MIDPPPRSGQHVARADGGHGRGQRALHRRPQLAGLLPRPPPHPPVAASAALPGDLRDDGVVSLGEEIWGRSAIFTRSARILGPIDMRTSTTTTPPCTSRVQRMRDGPAPRAAPPLDEACPFRGLRLGRSPRPLVPVPERDAGDPNDTGTPFAAQTIVSAWVDGAWRQIAGWRGPRRGPRPGPGTQFADERSAASARQIRSNRINAGLAVEERRARRRGRGRRPVG